MLLGLPMLELLFLETVQGALEQCKAGEREDVQEMAYYKLEHLGHSVGYKLALQ